MSAANIKVTKPRLALFIGISIFPVIVRMCLTSGLISAFYRRAIAANILLPFTFYKKKLKRDNIKMLLPMISLGIATTFYEKRRPVRI